MSGSLEGGAAFCSCSGSQRSPEGGGGLPGSVRCRCPPWNLACGRRQLREGEDRFPPQLPWEPRAPWGGSGVGAGGKREGPGVLAEPGAVSESLLQEGIPVPTAQTPSVPEQRHSSVPHVQWKDITQHQGE